MLVTRSSRTASASNSDLISLEGALVSRVQSTMHLGIHVSSKLSWSGHIQRLVEQATPKVALLKCMAYRLHLLAHILMRFYLVLLRPSPEYGSVVWNDCCKEDALQLEKLQIRVGRVVLGCAGLYIRNSEVLQHLQ